MRFALSALVGGALVLGIAQFSPSTATAPFRPIDHLMVVGSIKVNFQGQTDADTVTTPLRDLGAKGYELVAVVPGPVRVAKSANPTEFQYVMFFKRVRP